MPHYALVVAQRIAESVAVARSITLHPRAEKQMKAYKVTLPKRKAMILDHLLRSHGVTLSAMTEGWIDQLVEQHDLGTTDFPFFAERTIRAREIDARRRSRAWQDESS